MVLEEIVDWLKSYAMQNGMHGFIIGISGGIDSAVVSTLCARTGLPTLVVSIPINQNEVLDSRSELQKNWLKANYSNVEIMRVDLSKTFNQFSKDVISDALGFANSKSRLRMVTLYALAGPRKFLVTGTGNKVEDFGVGFFTKYGDGGVDISPIADLMKSQVYEIAKHFGIPKEIQEAKPTDGLWDDDRNDEDQIGATYPELEWAMMFDGDISTLTSRQKEVIEIYTKFNLKNKHKMVEIPIFKLK
jgi:NAD+ synthase